MLCGEDVSVQAQPKQRGLTLELFRVPKLSPFVGESFFVFSFAGPPPTVAEALGLLSKAGAILG